MKIWMLIGLMTLVTYLPRLIPLLFLTERPLPPFLRRFLNFIPYTALGTLLIPGVFSAAPGKPLAVCGGIATAMALSWWKGGFAGPVLGAIAVTYWMLGL